MKTPSLARRKFLKLGAAGAAACAMNRPLRMFGANEYGGRSIPIALQLYSVRDDCAKDLDGTITAVAKMGYRGVEFAGYYGRKAADLRKLLDDVGLKCCGTHIQLETLLGEQLPRTVEFNRILGNRFLIVPSLPEKYRKSRASWIEAAEVFNELAEKVKPQGMRVGYHNHNLEFTPVGGEVPEDIFFDHARKEVILQFDTGNGMSVGGDPMIFLPKYPGRAASIHVKAYSKTKPNALLGADELPWRDIFHVC